MSVRCKELVITLQKLTGGQTAFCVPILWPWVRKIQINAVNFCLCEYFRQFLERYDQFLAPDGHIEFKTDNQDLFTFSVEEIEESPIWNLDASTRDLHHDPKMNEGNIMTEYEEKFSSMGNPICKLIASR